MQPAEEQRPIERVVLDTSALLSGRRSHLIAGAAAGYYIAYWSSWIVGEVARKRTEWVAQRMARQGADLAEMRRQLAASRERVNHLIRELSGVLHSVDYTTAPPTDLTWLNDPDDWPIMQTALASRADILVTDNSADFPLGQQRSGILLLSSHVFLSRLYTSFPDAESVLQDYLR